MIIDLPRFVAAERAYWDELHAALGKMETEPERRLPLAEIERRVIHSTLNHVSGDKRLCAQLLGIATRTIYRRLEEDRDGGMDSATDPATADESR